MQTVEQNSLCLSSCVSGVALYKKKEKNIQNRAAIEAGAKHRAGKNRTAVYFCGAASRCQKAPGGNTRTGFNCCRLLQCHEHTAVTFSVMAWSQLLKLSLCLFIILLQFCPLLSQYEQQLGVSQLCVMFRITICSKRSPIFPTVSLNHFLPFLYVLLPSDEFDAYIIVSFVNATLVLSIGETVEEVTDSGFLGTTPTLSCSLLGEDALVQVRAFQEFCCKLRRIS